MIENLHNNILDWLSKRLRTSIIIYFGCRILRSAGLIGEVTATWRITPSDTTVFTTASTTVVFADGQSEAVITVQVRSGTGSLAALDYRGKY